MGKSKLWSKHGLKMVPFAVKYMILYIIRARIYQTIVQILHNIISSFSFKFKTIFVPSIRGRV